MGGVASLSFLFFFFNDTATTEIYTLSLHDALPIYNVSASSVFGLKITESAPVSRSFAVACFRSEEHTSELQSQSNLVCRLLLEKKKTKEQTRMSWPCPQTTHLLSTLHRVSLADLCD